MADETATITWARSTQAMRARAMVEVLQQRFKDALERVTGERFGRVAWARGGGAHGGGARFVLAETARINRAAINVSQVHYDDEPSKRLASATAISTIIHPEDPRAPSVHIHVSWTEMRDGSGAWRVMADLNPAIPDAEDTARFAAALRSTAPAVYAYAAAQGERYFYIPALRRTRGATHFYLERYATADKEADLALAAALGDVAVDTYVEILSRARPPVVELDRASQRAYHTLYLFQVLTLDRGTSSGILVHDENDLGIMGSLPSFVDRTLLASWASRVPAPQDALVRAIVDALPADGHVDDDARRRLAGVVRAHFTAHPDALALQAAGDIVPPTVADHRG